MEKKKRTYTYRYLATAPARRVTALREARKAYIATLLYHSNLYASSSGLSPRIIVSRARAFNDVLIVRAAIRFVVIRHAARRLAYLRMRRMRLTARVRVGTVDAALLVVHLRAVTLLQLVVRPRVAQHFRRLYRRRSRLRDAEMRRPYQLLRAADAADADNAAAAATESV